MENQNNKKYKKNSKQAPQRNQKKQGKPLKSEKAKKGGRQGKLPISGFSTLSQVAGVPLRRTSIKEKEVLEEGQSISYLGSGTFGVCQKSEDGKYTIVKRIEVENKDDSLKMKNYVEGLKA